jgi:hypothetical protein
LKISTHFPPTTSRGLVQQGLSFAGGALGLFQLGLATDKRYSLDRMDILPVIQTAASLTTPLVVLVLGWQINRRLEQSKLSLSKEKEWQTKWAESFFLSASGFNQAVEDSVHLFFEISQQPQDDSRGVTREKEKLLWEASERIQRTEWSLKTHVQFAPRSRDQVLTAASKVIELCAQLFKEKKGNLEEIRVALFAFNAASRAAHRELLAP